MFISTEKDKFKYFRILTWTHTTTNWVLHWTGLKKMLRSHFKSPLGCCSNKDGMPGLVLWRKNIFFFIFSLKLWEKKGLEIQ